MNPLGLVLVVLTTLFPAFQLFALPGISDPVALFSQYLGLAALILMAWTPIWAARLPGMESIFGGLDRQYILHKWAGITAMGAMLVHNSVDAGIRGIGSPLNDLAEGLGEVSLYGLLALAVLSVATFIPYQFWKWTHKGMGALFALGAAHFVLIAKPFAMTDPAGLFTGLFCVAGLLAYAWTLIPDSLRPSRSYRISKLETTGGATAVTLAPTGSPMKPEPGQFGLVRFTGSGKREPHPFSFSKIEPDGSLRVTIKSLGDFTSSIGSKLAVGQSVRVQGPFGRFRKPSKGRQVWIAGGIGITPFLAWSEALDPAADPVDLFYCVRSRQTAPHLEEIETLASAKPNLRLHLIASAEGRRLTTETILNQVGGDIGKTRVAYCGPVGLRRTLQKELKSQGLSPRRFHYEEFEFRTGLGLSRWIPKATKLWRPRAA